MKLFVTVGTTGFDDLIATTDTAAFYDNCLNCGINKVLFQIGNGSHIPNNFSTVNISVDHYRFKSSIHDDLSSSDLIVSAGGAGTISEALSLNKRLIVVINNSLLHNHQIELAKKYASLNYCLMANSPSMVLSLLEEALKNSFTPFPSPQPSLLWNYLESFLPDKSS
ncbi:hypothetical protein RCL1_004246 [Eukaryota sp. TZLM3-RCL]